MSIPSSIISRILSLWATCHLYDSVLSYFEKSARDALIHAHKIELYLNNDKLIANKVGFALNLGWMNIRLRNSYYKQFDAGEIDLFDRTTRLLPASGALNGRKAEPIWFFSGAIKFHWGEKLQNVLFFRFNYYYQKGTFQKYGGSPDLTQFDPKLFYTESFYNNFVQAHLGVAIDMKKIFGIEEK